MRRELEKGARTVHVFKCNACGRERRYTGDVKNTRKGCTNINCRGTFQEDHIEVIDTDGVVRTVIV